MCQQRQEQVGLPLCTDAPWPIFPSRATVSPVDGFCPRTSWLAALHAWRAAGRAVRQISVRQVQNGRGLPPSLPAEVRWFSCFAAFRRPLDLAGGRQLPALAEGVKVES